jgi:hypothetical protein
MLYLATKNAKDAKINKRIHVIFFALSAFFAAKKMNRRKSK